MSDLCVKGKKKRISFLNRNPRDDFTEQRLVGAAAQPAGRGPCRLTRDDQGPRAVRLAPVVLGEAGVDAGVVLRDVTDFQAAVFPDEDSVTTQNQCITPKIDTLLLCVWMTDACHCTQMTGQESRLEVGVLWALFLDSLSARTEAQQVPLHSPATVSSPPHTPARGGTQRPAHGLDGLVISPSTPALLRAQSDRACINNRFNKFTLV